MLHKRALTVTDAGHVLGVPAASVTALLVKTTTDAGAPSPRRMTGCLAIGTGKPAMTGEVTVTPEATIAKRGPDEAGALPPGVVRLKKGGEPEPRIRRGAGRLRLPIMVSERMIASTALSLRPMIDHTSCSAIDFLALALCKMRQCHYLRFRMASCCLA